jgi:hypothetical protein
LEARGLKVWYSGRELSAGDDIENTIQEGLEQSRFGIAVLSKKYLSKNWTVKEYFLLKAREKPNYKVLLPVLYDISVNELTGHDPNMANTFSLNLEKGLDWVVDRLVAKMQMERKVDQQVQRKRLIRLMPFVLGLTVIALLSYLLTKPEIPDGDAIKALIDERVSGLQNEMKVNHIRPLEAMGASVASMKEIDSIFTRFAEIKARYRNEYDFYNGGTIVRFKKNVEPITGIDLDSFGPENDYLLDNPHIRLARTVNSAGQTEIRYGLINESPLRYVISEAALTGEDKYEVTVKYENPIRYVEVTLTFPSKLVEMKRHHLTLIGFKSRETYQLSKKAGDWVFDSVR